MSNLSLAPNHIGLGDPVPWFSGQYLSGQPFDFNIAAGRWIVLAFLGSLASDEAQDKLNKLLSHHALFSENHIVVYCVLTQSPGAAAIADLEAASSPVLRFVADYDRKITTRFGAEEPRTIVLDPMLRAIANIPWTDPQGHDALLAGLLQSLPPVDDFAGVPLIAPILIVPRVLDFPLCEALIGLYQKFGGEESGFMRDKDGKTMTVVDHAKKRRKDMIVALPEFRERIRQRLVTRLIPAIELFFQYKATRIDRYMVACYDSATGGYFGRHRDNLNAGSEHRRFAVSLNLNSNYEGCDITFPEFGTKKYRAPAGGAVVFSCGALHEVSEITKGTRYAFLPFLYSDVEAAKRLENNARLHAGEIPYRADQDRLFPEEAKLDLVGGQ